MDKIYFDIETIPTQRDDIRESIRESIEHPKTMKKTETIEEWYKTEFEAEFEKQLDKTALDGAFGHVVSIGYAVNDDKPTVLHAESVENEEQIIREFFAIVKENRHATLVGHNILNFDLKFLKHRSMVLGIKLPVFIPFDAKPWDNCLFDTMLQWDSKNFISLDKLCKAFGIKGKGDINGSMVHKLWRAGKHNDIKEYCMSDVELTREVAKRMLGE